MKNHPPPPPVEVAPLPAEKLYGPQDLPPWWQYRKFSTEEVEKIQKYFETNTASLENGLTSDVKENLKILSQKIGSPLPPQFIRDDITEFVGFEKKDQSDFGSQMQSIQQQDTIKQPEPEQPSDIPKLSFFILNSLKLDMCTFKILSLALKGAAVKVLRQNNQEQIANKLNSTSFERINNSYFDDNTLNELLKLLITNKISKLFFDWNNLEMCSNTQEFFVNLFKQCQELEVVTLRNCNIDDQTFGLICQTITEKASTCKLKFIDFFKNTFTDEALPYLDKLLESYDKINYIGLSGNNIKNISTIFRHIGKRVLSPEQLIEHRQKEEERDEIILRNQKSKGKTVEEVPYVLPIKEVGQDKFAFFFNEQLQLLNLAHNPISEQDKETIDSFLGSCFEGFTLSVSGSLFDKKTIEKFKKKYNKKINFC